MPGVVVTSEEGVALQAGPEAVVEGVYEQQDLRMMPVGPPQHLGHVALVLEDGSLVFLYPPETPEARRRDEEIQRFEHKRVRASGFLHPSVPQEGAVPLGGCLVDIEAIEVVE